MSTETLGSLIHRLRAGKGLTLDEVAQHIGTSKAFVCLIEKDKSGVSVENAGKLASLFGIDVNVLIDLQDARRGEKTESWVRYIVSKYQPSEYVLGICRKFVTDSGFSGGMGLEGDARGFEARWDAFYSLVKQVLDNPNIKVFIDESVQQILRKIGMAGCDSWKSLQQKVNELIVKRLGDGEECKTSVEWREHVQEVLGIETVRLNSDKIAPLMMGALTAGGAQDVLAGMTMVAASPNIYGAVYKLRGATKEKRRYCFIEDMSGEKCNLKSETFWYEAARVLLDEELSLGHGCEYVPDGAPFKPLHYFLTRIGSWMALAFKQAQEEVDKIEREPSLSPSIVVRLKKKVAPDLPIRFAMVGFLDQLDRPLLYLDCYFRLKKDQLEQKGVLMSDVVSMRKDPESLLRVGYSFRNVVASDLPTNIRFNLRIPDASVIKKAYDVKGNVEGCESLEDWDARYSLKGKVRICAEFSNTGHENVRSIMECL